MWFRICILVAVSVPATGSWARDIYVNNVMGDDRNDGSAAVRGRRSHRALSDAFASACARRATGDRVHRREHRGAVSGEHHVAGSSSEWFSGRAVRVGGERGGVGRVSAGAARRVELCGGQSVPISTSQDRFSDACIWTASQCGGARARVAGRLLGHLQPLEWCLYQQHVYFRGEANRQPQTYAMSFAGMQVRHHVVRGAARHCEGFCDPGVSTRRSQCPRRRARDDAVGTRLPWRRTQRNLGGRCLARPHRCVPGG